MAGAGRGRATASWTIHPSPRYRARRTSGVRNTIGIGIGAVVGWPGLAWCWWLVIADGDAPTATMLSVPLLLAAVTVVLTTLWVRHNLAIHRRKGPRRAVPVAPYPYLTDRRGRPLHFDDAHMRSARHVVVGVGADGAKHYGVAP